MKLSISMHAVNTWLLAHLLHPVIFLILSAAIGGTQDIDADFIMIVTVCGFLFSIPAILLLVIGLHLTFRLPVQQPGIAFLIWIGFATAAVFASGCFLLFWFSGRGWYRDLDWQLVRPFLPAVLAAVIAILIRFNQFVRLFISWRDAGISEQDNQILYDEIK